MRTRAVGFVLLAGCSLFEGPGDYPPRDAAADKAPADAGTDAPADAPSGLGDAPSAACDAGPICQCMMQACAKETNDCLASPSCVCGLACAHSCTNALCLETCLAKGGNEGNAWLGCLGSNCVTSCQ
jgi:hypothetical protein